MAKTKASTAAPAVRPFTKRNAFGDRLIDENTAKRINARIDAMTAEEFRESLVVAGIITKSGKLAKRYRN